MPPAEPTTAAAPLPEPPDAWRTPAVDALADALLAMRTRDEMTALLRDLCSLHELEVLAHRWQAAGLLDQGIPYARVAQRVNGSTAAGSPPPPRGRPRATWPTRASTPR